ncbi:hypothetical protein [Maliponia aquimaris]|uniref:HTH DNA binding domain protein n=1 Tax=Maliponia aquimaris TaxID=1673631 RepID=A0A238L3Z2_9RHOB|nr:hypothetical protein [Maliponia aquimaris]SMX49805.1 hypothetical protein MAA8898_04453 [Maliponia aquimaris]
MKSQQSVLPEELEDDTEGPYDGAPSEEDLWFLPGPPEDEPDFLPPLPRAEPDERALVADWQAAQASQALRLARVAARFGALDDRLARGPEGWRHRLALLASSEFSWMSGDRVSVDRLGLWQAMRLGATDEDTTDLQRAAWTFRRLSGGPGPEPDFASFLGRHEVEGVEPLTEKVAAWNAVMGLTSSLHPLVRACFAFHLWPLTGIGPEGDVLEGAVVAARLSGAEGQGGALFAPLQIGGAGGLRGADPEERLGRWLKAAEQGIIGSMRQIDQLEAWEARAIARSSRLSGRTPPRLISVLRDWPLVTAPMAEELTGASRAAIQRNLAWLEAEGLVQEVTGQGRFRVWRASV